jgi:undecaprenyl diphosphate synthase
MSEPKPVTCIGIILDGNRRWAKEKGLPTLEGHRRGFENLKSAARWVRDRGVAHLVVYAFSTENWKRPPEEVAGLMDLIREAVLEKTDDLVQEGIRLRFIGERGRLGADVRDAIETAEQKSQGNTNLTLWICLSYGGRAEIAAAARAAAKQGLEITEENIALHLWTQEMPEPDIVIRSGGQHRLSNFLLWQSAYSELFFLDVLWPDFTEADLDGVLSEFKERKRNFGI